MHEAGIHGGGRKWCSAPGAPAHLSPAVCRHTPALSVSFLWPVSLLCSSTYCPCPPRSPRPTLDVTCSVAGGSHALAKPLSRDPSLAPEVSWLLRGAPESWAPLPPIPPSSNQPSTNARWKLVETAPASALLGEPIQGWAQAPGGPHPPPAGGQHAFSWAVLRVGCPSCDTVGCCPAPCSPLTGRVWDSLQRGTSLLLLTSPKPLSSGTWPSQ